MPRYLFGPTTRAFARDKLALLRASGDCLAFDPAGETDLRAAPGDSWAAIASQFPPGWEPDFIALWPAYGVVPEGIWEAPVPVALLAVDWNLLWHQYRAVAGGCEWVLTDTTGVEAFTAAGLPASRANLYGCGLDDLAPPPATPRDIDVLFVGNLNPAVQGERMPWLARLARLADRYRVVIRTGVYGADYRALHRRARVVFNRSIRGECNQRVFEAAAAGALLVQEAGNREVPGVFADRRECVYYRDDDLEAVLGYYLGHEGERAAIAAAGRARAGDGRFDRLLQPVLAELDVTELRARRAARPAGSPATRRGCELLSVPPTGWANPALTAPLRRSAAGDPQAAYFRGLIAPPDAATGWFERAVAVEPDWWPARLAQAEVLEAAGRRAEALEAVRSLLDGWSDDGGIGWDRVATSYPPRFDAFRVEWERVGWQNAGDPAAEARAKRTLLRWRLLDRVAAWTGELGPAEAAARLRPDLAAAQAAWGEALARAGRATEAIAPLRAAVAADPFSTALAQRLAEALGRAGNGMEAATVRAEAARFARAVPDLAPRPRPGAPSPRRPRRIVWEGGLLSVHSYAQVNRAVTDRLIARGHELALRPRERTGGPAEPGLSPALALRVDALLGGPADVWVRHQWPPDLTPPPEGRFVLVQPWEFGSLPCDWAAAARDRVDEVWAYSRAVRDCYLAAGVPPEKVAVVPLGVDPSRFRPDAEPVPLPTRKRFRFLFVGGTIHRKGFDLLLEAYGRAFTAADAVALVVKDVGAGSFYGGQTAGDRVAAFRARPAAPELLYLPDPIPADRMPGLYAACDCLVLPFRGEGFGLPVAEAMACGRPAVVTDASPATDYCDRSTGFLVPTRRVAFRACRVGNRETVARPWLHEPDLPALVEALRAAADDPAAARRKGQAAAERIRSGWTWDHTARAIEERLDRLVGSRSGRR